jgi:uncharacterized protein
MTRRDQFGSPVTATLRSHGARWDGADLLLPVRVVPRSAADAVVVEADTIKVKITAPPVDGKANEHLCRLLGKLFGVPRSRVVVERGSASRAKLIRIVGPQTLPAWLG